MEPKKENTAVLNFEISFRSHKYKAFSLFDTNLTSPASVNHNENRRRNMEVGGS